jgi:hypothetical protein
MRTKRQQASVEVSNMAKEIKSAIERSADTLIVDALGAVALVVLLYVSLTLPSLF